MAAPQHKTRTFASISLVDSQLATAALEYTRINNNYMAFNQYTLIIW
jgi:hypothetical protein